MTTTRPKTKPDAEEHDAIAAAVSSLGQAEGELERGRLALGAEARAAKVHLDDLVAAETSRLRAPAEVVAQLAQAETDLETRRSEEATAHAAHVKAEAGITDLRVEPSKAAADLQTAAVVLTRARAATVAAKAHLDGLLAELDRAKTVRCEHPSLPAPFDRLRTLRARRYALLAEVAEVERQAVAVTEGGADRLVRGQWAALKIADDIDFGGRVGTDGGQRHASALLRALFSAIEDGSPVGDFERTEDQIAAILEGRWPSFKDELRRWAQARKEGTDRAFAEAERSRAEAAEIDRAKVRIAEIEPMHAKARAWIAARAKEPSADLRSYEEVAAKLADELDQLRARVAGAPTH